MQEIEKTENTEKEPSLPENPAGETAEGTRDHTEADTEKSSVGDRKQSDRINAGFAAMRRRYEKEIANLKAQNGVPEGEAETAYGDGAGGAAKEASGTAAGGGEPAEPGEEKTGEAESAEEGESGEEDAKAEQLRFRLDYLRELAEISRYDPAIRTPEDLENDPEIGKIRELISRGNTLADAWFLAHRTQLFDRVRAEGRKEAFVEGRQAAYPPAGSIPDVYVTPEERALFRAVIPGITDAEIRAAARKYRP